MNLKTYLGDLNGGSLLIAETRLIAEIQLESLSADEWKRRVIDNNVLQKKSVQTSLRFGTVIRKRLERMGEDFINDRMNSFPELANYTESTQKKMGANVIKALMWVILIRHDIANYKACIYYPKLNNY